METPGEDLNDATEPGRPATWPKAIAAMAIGFLVPCILLVNMNTIATLATESNELVVYLTAILALAMSGFLVRIGASSALNLYRQRE